MSFPPSTDKSEICFERCRPCCFCCIFLPFLGFDSPYF